MYFEEFISLVKMMLENVHRNTRDLHKSYIRNKIIKKALCASKIVPDSKQVGCHGDV